MGDLIEIVIYFFATVSINGLGSLHHTIGFLENVVHSGFNTYTYLVMWPKKYKHLRPLFTGALRDYIELHNVGGYFWFDHPASAQMPLYGRTLH